MLSFGTPLEAAPGLAASSEFERPAGLPSPPRMEGSEQLCDLLSRRTAHRHARMARCAARSTCPPYSPPHAPTRLTDAQECHFPGSVPDLLHEVEPCLIIISKNIAGWHSMAAPLGSRTAL
jgi:hypothetical protein